MTPYKRFVSRAMADWIKDARHYRDANEPAIRVTVAGLRGSAPREVGATMLVSVNDSSGTIGGGELEYQCTKIAARLLAGGSDTAHSTRGFLRRFPLGSNCGQCCGGVVDVLFQHVDSIGCFDALVADWKNRNNSALLTTLDESGEPRNSVVKAGDHDAAGRVVDEGACQEVVRILNSGAPAMRLDTPGRGNAFALLEPLHDKGFDIAVFGAGHVGSAVVQLLSGLDARVRWIDSRRAIFPAAMPVNVQALEVAEPAREVAALPAGSYYLVMTHSHALDLDITAAILRRADGEYCGLIGSLTKRRRFEARLRSLGFDDRILQRLTCPIGIAGISGKQPQKIAIAVCAEILRRHERQQPAAGKHPARVHMLRP